MRTVRKMLKDAVAEGLTITVGSDGETDYQGTTVADALDAIEALDEASVWVRGEGVRGWALILVDLDDDEMVADCSGWVDRWTAANSRD